MTAFSYALRHRICFEQISTNFEILCRQQQQQQLWKLEARCSHLKICFKTSIQNIGQYEVFSDENLTPLKVLRFQSQSFFDATFLFNHFLSEGHVQHWKKLHNTAWAFAVPYFNAKRRLSEIESQLFLPEKSLHWLWSDFIK